MVNQRGDPPGSMPLWRNDGLQSMQKNKPGFMELMNGASYLHLVSKQKHNCICVHTVTPDSHIQPAHLWPGAIESDVVLIYRK